MEMTGEQLIAAPQAAVWAALNDPQALKACVAGCEALDRIADNEFQVLMVSRIGPVSAKFRGKLTLSDVRAPESYTLSFEGQGGAAGFAKGGAKVRLAPEGAQTRLSYDVKANVGGKLAQIGSRLIDAAARKVADDFFNAFNARFSAGKSSAGKHHTDGHHTDGHHAEDHHHPEPVARDPDLAKVSDSTLGFLAAGILVVTAVALFSFFG